MAATTAATLSFKSTGGEPQVAIVTGAARGLGRVWALALAARGVRVLVNDCDPDHALVDAVVREIAARGGEALADYSSVEQGAAVVARTLQRWKRVDILINVRRSQQEEERASRGDGDGGALLISLCVVAAERDDHPRRLVPQYDGERLVR